MAHGFKQWGCASFLQVPASPVWCPHQVWDAGTGRLQMCQTSLQPSPNLSVLALFPGLLSSKPLWWAEHMATAMVQRACWQRWLQR